MYAIETENLTKQYKDVVAVNRLNLKIGEGELFGLLGVNGAGKTTTIKMLSCIEKPTFGDAKLNGYSILNAKDKVKEVISLSPQETAIASNLTTRENLELIGGIYGLKKEETAKRIASLSKRVGIDGVMDKRAGKLSGGYQRRLSICMALISNPKILFLDEPTLGLDVIARSELWDVIREIKANTTVILTTHYLEEAEHLADRIGIMKDGKLLFTGTSEELKKATGESEFEQAFLKTVKGVNDEN